MKPKLSEDYHVSISRHHLIYRGAAVLRLATFLFGAIYLFAYSDQEVIFFDLGVITCFLGIVYSLLPSLWKLEVSEKKAQNRTLAITIFTDLVLGLLLVVVTGGFLSPFKLYIIFLVFFLSYAFGSRYSLVGGVSVLLFYGVYGTINGLSQEIPKFIFPHLGFLVIISFFGGSLAKEESKMCDSLNETLKMLASVNRDLLDSNEVLKERMAVQRAFYETGKALVNNISLQETLEILLQRAIELVGGGAGVIGIWDSQGNKGRFISVVGLEELAGKEFSISQGVFGEVAATGEPLLIRDSKELNLRSSLEKQIDSIAAVPLKFQGEFLGVLGVTTNREMEPFDEESLKLLEGFADLAATGINRANLYEEVLTKSRQLTNLLELSRQIAASLDQQTILNTVVKTAVEETDSAWGLICLVSRDGKYLRKAAKYGLDFELDMASQILIEGNPIFQQLIQTGGPLEFTEPTEKTSACFVEMEPTCIIRIPMVGKNSVVGVLSCAKAGAESFTAAEKDYLTQLSLSAAIAIDNAELYQDVKVLAERDPLTGLYNQRLLYTHLSRECERSRDGGYPVTVIMIDVDDFKLFNDRYGHQAGDKILRQVADIMRNELRETDFIYRYGGEEFCIILPKISKAEGMQIAERIHTGLREDECCVTLSMGIATYPEDSDDPEEVIRIADQAMYKAKNSGKNATAH